MKRFFALVLLLVGVVAAPAFLFAQEKTTSTLSADAVVEKVYFAHGDSVTVMGTVDDDAYLAGGTVDVSGAVNGDLIAAGGTVTISGTVEEDVRVAGGTVLISGTVGGNVTVGGGTVTISENAKIGGTLIAGAGTFNNRAPVGSDIYVGAGTALLNSEVGGDVHAAVNDLTIGETSDVAGNLTYTSERQASIADNSQVGGVVNFRRVESDAKEAGAGAKQAGAGAFIVGKVISHVFLFIIGLLYLHFFPVFTRQVVSAAGDHKLRHILYGFLLLIGVPFASLILAVTVVGLPVAIVALFAYFILFYIAKLFVAMYLGRITVTRFSKSKSDVLMLLVGLAVHLVLTILPVLGWLIGGTLMLWGAGVYVSSKVHLYNSLRTKKII